MKRYIIYALGIACSLLLLAGCSKAEPTQLEVRLMNIVVKEKKSDGGQYVFWQKEEDPERVAPSYTPSIKGFDEVYEEGVRYYLEVKYQKEKGARATYLWTGKEWASRKRVK